MDTFADLMTTERARLDNEKQQIAAQQAELMVSLEKINAELAAISAYEAVKTGKPAAKPKGSQRSMRRGSKRDELMALIRDSSGISRGEILERMGLKGDKAGEMSVSNALTALVKANAVTRDGGKYQAAA